MIMPFLNVSTQVRPVQSHPNAPALPTSSFPALAGGVLDPSAAVVGRKAAAMAYFQRVGLFDDRLLVIPPCDIGQALARIRKIEVPLQGMTLRFSQGEALGLPRMFVRSQEELVDTLRRIHKEDWTTIVHPYLDVRRSFEANVENAHWILEHVPGMWESDNALLPDMLQKTQDSGLEANLYAFERSARVASTSGTWAILESPPTRKAQAQAWAEKFQSVLVTLRRDFQTQLPINVHFVEDNTQKWHFLNVRAGFHAKASDNSVRSAELHPIASLSDLDGWDGARPLLFRATTERGNESSLHELLGALRRRTSTVYVDFGLLSHPAIVMREFGLTVLSANRLATPSGRQRFEHHELR